MRRVRRVLEVEGLRLCLEETGAGSPVVLLHGALTGREDGLLALEGAAHRFRLLAFDRPGYGESEGRGDTASAWAQAAIFAEAIRQLDIDRPVVVGHSFGGAVALAWALLAPETIRGVVALAPLAFPEPRAELLMFGPRAAPIAGDLLSYALMPMDSLVMPAVWSAMFSPQAPPPQFSGTFPTDQAGERRRLRTTGREAAWLVPDLVRSALGYATCRVRMEVVAGDRDRIVNPRLHARPLATCLPQANFTTAPGVGHMVHHARPDLVVAALRNLVRETGPADA